MRNEVTPAPDPNLVGTHIWRCVALVLAGQLFGVPEVASEGRTNAGGNPDQGHDGEDEPHGFSPVDDGL